jgi:hypothetical protein
VYSEPASSGYFYEWKEDKYQYNWKSEKSQSGYWYRIYAIVEIDGNTTTFSTVIGLR